MRIMNIQSIHELPRSTKRLIFMAVDSLLVPLSLYCAFALRYGTGAPWGFMSSSWALFGAMTFFGIGITWALGLHRIKLNAFDTHSMYNIGVAAVLLAISAVAMSYMLELSAPRSVPLLLGLFFCLFAVTVRLVGVSLIRWLSERGGDRKPVAIYGAGAAGCSLSTTTPTCMD